jgi:hypothetical protein
MTENRERLTLATIKNGALVEQFDRALSRVVDNIADINTTTQPREITLIIKITPNDDRTFLEVDGGVKTKIAGQEKVKTTADLSIDDRGRAVAFNREKKQFGIPFRTIKIHGEKDNGDV